MRGLSLLVAALVLFAGITTPVAAQETETETETEGDGEVTLTVSVVNGAGAPVADADLTARWDEGSANVTTAGNGKAFVDVPSGADVRFDVSHSAYVRNRPHVVRNASEGDVTITVARGGSLSMRVRDSEGPVGNARVILRSGGDIVDDARTDDAGRYTVEPIEQGTYSVVVRKVGYYRNISTVEVDGSVERSAVIRQGSVTLHFNVTDPHYSPPRPVGGATLALDGVGQTVTLSSGEQVINAPVNSRIALEVSKDAYETTTRTIEIGERDRWVNVSVSRVAAANLTAVSERVVAGERVAVEVADEYGQPIENATILLDGESAARTDGTGGAAVRVPSSGEHELRARTGRLESDPVTVRAVSAETPTPESTSTPTPAPTASPTASPTATAAPQTTDGGSGVTTLGFTVLTGLLGMAVSIAALLFVRRD
jgi:hypothetical protein